MVQSNGSSQTGPVQRQLMNDPEPRSQDPGPFTNDLRPKRAYLQNAEGPQQVGELLCIELLLVTALQDLTCEGRQHVWHVMKKGGIGPQDVGDVLQ